MKKLLVALSLVVMSASPFAHVANAGGGPSSPDYIIDCSDDPDPGSDNALDIWAEYSGTFLLVLTQNCTYTCALGNIDPATPCTSAYFDSGAPRFFSVQGYGLVHGYSPGSYDVELMFGTTADELDLTASQGDGYLIFEWNQIPGVIQYQIRAVQDPNVECVVTVGEGSCAITSAPVGETYSYVMSVDFDFDGITKTQSMVTTVDAILQPEVETTTTVDDTPTTVDDTAVRTDSTLVNTGSGSNRTVLVAVVLSMLGLIVLLNVRRQRITKL